MNEITLTLQQTGLYFGIVILALIITKPIVEAYTSHYIYSNSKVFGALGIWALFMFTLVFSLPYIL
jgi:hypothetical protein